MKRNTTMTSDTKSIIRTSAIVAAGLALWAQPAAADTVVGNGTVTATVQAACNLVSVPTVAFGTVSSVGPLAAEIVASGSISVACSNGASYTVYIGDGANRVGAGTGNRQMANGAGRLAYQLYKGGWAYQRLGCDRRNRRHRRRWRCHPEQHRR